MAFPQHNSLRNCYKYFFYLDFSNDESFREFFSACDGSDDEDVGETGDEDGEDLSADEAIATHSDKNMEDDDMNWLDNYFDSFGDDEMVTFFTVLKYYISSFCGGAHCARLR